MRARPLLPVFACVALASASCTVPPDEDEIDGPEPIGEAVSAITVQQAADTSCSTASVKGLSEQIVAQANCITPGAFVKVPALGNLVLGSAVFPYLEQPARDAFVSALNANPGTVMHVNSMLRTVAQQYLLYSWYLQGQCGIALAAKPGNSNHETGLALDVSEYNTWKSALGAKGFQWFGTSDPVHFDYVGPGAVDYKGTDVLAFQKLWNKNNPSDLISEDGAWGPQTQARMQQAPAGGFAIGPNCNAPPPGPDVYPALAIRDATDALSDHSSQGTTDLFEGEAYAVAMTIENKGSAAASNVDVGVAIDAPYLVAEAYLIESDWQHPGTFTENDANTDPANPPHDAPPGAAFTLKMNALSPGETKRVTVTVRAAAYSMSAADPPGLRFWVKDIPGAYHQDDFGAPPSTSNGQTFGGGTLQVDALADVYSRTHWEWDSDRFEGWTASGNATLSSDPAVGVLLLGAQGDDPGAAISLAAIPTATYSALELRAKRTGGDGGAKLYFATAEDPALGEDKAIDFDLPDDDAFHTITIKAAVHPGWTGTVTTLRLDPFIGGTGSVELDYLRAIPADGGSSSSGAGAGGAGGAPGDGLDGAGPTEGSCACSTPENSPESTGRWAPWAALLATLALWRRHRRPAPC